MPLDTASFGFPVELAKVSNQLKKLWESEGQTKFRASILNLAVVSHNTDTLEQNTRLIAQLVREHACRAFVVGVAPGTEPRISAWIQAHCHLNRAGAKQVCSEQITLLAEGCSEDAYAHALLAHLDYDLPLTLWWQGELPENPNSALWPAVDRLIFDTREWRDLSTQLTALHRTRCVHARGMVWADLNWTRTLAMRQAFAQCFDASDCLPHLEHAASLRIRHNTDSRSTATLLACWFAAQLGWTPLSCTPEQINFRSRSGATITCSMECAGTPPLSEAFFESPALRVHLRQPPEASRLHALIRSDSHTPREAVFSAGPMDALGLLTAEMIPGSRHRVYQRTLSIAQAIPGQAPWRG